MSSATFGCNGAQHVCVGKGMETGLSGLHVAHEKIQQWISIICWISSDKKCGSRCCHNCYWKSCTDRKYKYMKRPKQWTDPTNKYCVCIKAWYYFISERNFYKKAKKQISRHQWVMLLYWVTFFVITMNAQWSLLWLCFTYTALLHQTLTGASNVY